MRAELVYNLDRGSLPSVHPASLRIHSVNLALLRSKVDASLFSAPVYVTSPTPCLFTPALVHPSKWLDTTSSPPRTHQVVVFIFYWCIPYSTTFPGHTLIAFLPGRQSNTYRLQEHAFVLTHSFVSMRKPYIFWRIVYVVFGAMDRKSHK